MTAARTGSGGLAPPRAVYRARQRGFNLIEAAIVLAIVGFVLGGTWWAVSAVSENLKIKRTVEAITLSSSEARRLFPSWAIQQLLPVDGTALNITATIMGAKALPIDFLRPGSNVPVHPWGGAYHVSIQRGGGDMVNVLLFPPIPAHVCTKLITMVSAPYRDTSELRIIGVAGTPSTFISSNFPVDLERAKTACAASTITYLAFYYVASMR